jgi:hypothetical protein
VYAGQVRKEGIDTEADCRSMIINLKAPVMANAYAAAHEVYSELHLQDSDKGEGGSARERYKSWSAIQSFNPRSPSLFRSSSLGRSAATSAVRAQQSSILLSGG